MESLSVNSGPQATADEITAESAVYVSITGLRLKSGWHVPRFLWHALRCMAQARHAPGCLSAGARTIDGVHHTMTVWESRAAMRTYVASGPHLKAMRVFPKIATGKVVGFQTDVSPSWDEAQAIWQRDGREV